MTISYPVSAPSALKLASLEVHRHSVVGKSASPFTGEEQVYAHQGQWWEFDAQVVLQKRSDAQAVEAFLDSLNGMEGTFLYGFPNKSSPLGTWGTTPLVNGAHAIRASTLAVKGLTASTGTVTAGDMFQLGSGSGTHLHVVTVGGTANGSGQLSIEIWPDLRAALSGDEAITISSSKGIWRLASNRRSYVVRRGLIYECRFAAVESLNP